MAFTKRHDTGTMVNPLFFSRPFASIVRFSVSSNEGKK